MKSEKILCVDDEPKVLEGLQLNLRRHYKVYTAENGVLGLLAIEHNGPFSVVLSDMRMPGMNGADFLEKVREVSRDTVRMLLTGQADLQSTIDAVNKGQIFWFLTKPCDSRHLLDAIDAAVKQYQLFMAERVLLEQTLHGSISALSDTLSLSNPLAFGSASRIKQYASDLARHLKTEDRWQIEVAAMLSQLGSITLPEETAKKYHYGEELRDDEAEMIRRMPHVTLDLLSNIPRLEPVSDILAGQSKLTGNDSANRDFRRNSQILRIAVDFDHLVTIKNSEQLAIDSMCSSEGCYDPDLLEVFAQLRGITNEQKITKEIQLWSLDVGMVLAADVTLDNGVVLATRGYEVTRGFIERVQNFRQRLSSEKLTVIMSRNK